MIKRIFFLLLLVVVLGASGFAQWLNQPLAEISTEVTIEPGTSTKAIAAKVARATGANSTLLTLWFRAASLMGSTLGAKPQTIKAGTYAIEASQTPRSLLKKMVEGDELTFNLTIVEGWTFKQMRAAIDAAPNLMHTTAGLSDKELMEQLGMKDILPEGRFFPDTYQYPKGGTDLGIYQQAAKQLNKRLQAAWDGRASDLPTKNPTELLILASIVEKETGRPSDRAEIAGVFVNRLKTGMRLQTDPTVIYGMGQRFAQQRNNIKKSDLTTDTPYNTYTRDGLPPGPIALVGKAALAAASQPKVTDALYFVARGDGSSQFSATLAEHNAAVNRFIRGR